VDRIKKLSIQVLENNKADFGINFDENKKTLDGITIIRSKILKNRIAGYITRFLKHEVLDKKMQEEKLAKQTKLDEETSENLDSNASEVKSSNHPHLMTLRRLKKKHKKFLKTLQNKKLMLLYCWFNILMHVKFLGGAKKNIPYWRDNY